MNAVIRPAKTLRHRVLKWLNLRPEEAERTFLMLAFYTVVSIGAVWLEAIAAALFLGVYAVEKLTLVYIATSVGVTALGVIYAWLQRHLPLRWVMLGMSLLLALPLVVFWLWLGQKKTVYYAIAVFAMRLWVEAVYTLSNINNDITANQLFNIREVKRAFPIVSTGIIIAEIASGFSLPLLLRAIGIDNIVMASFAMLMLGVGLLGYISQRYRQAFPNSAYSFSEDGELSTRRLQGNIQTYVVLLFGFFVAAQVLFFLVDYQYYGQLELYYTAKEERIAQFVGLFGGTLGACKLMLQLFGSSRLIERLGSFAAVLIPPIMTAVLSVLAGIAPLGLLVGFVALKGFDELFRYTVVATTSPVLFQAVPEQFRSRIQSFVRGIADPISTGVAGVMILLLTQALKARQIDPAFSAQLFAGLILAVSLIWMVDILLLRRGYLQLLIQSVERGRLSLTDVDIREVRRAVSESLLRSGNEMDQRVCIELLTQVAPKSVGDSLAPLLMQMTPDLQRQSLEAMLLHPEERFMPLVRDLLESPGATPHVRSLCLRYQLLADPNPDINGLRVYLGREQNPLIRSTAVALMMRLGTPMQVAEATNTLRQMISSSHQPERVLGCQALAEAAYMQSLRFYVPQLLQDPSIEVRCALLRAIAATRASEYYPSLIRGLSYKATRKAAYEALVSLGDDALEPLLAVADDRLRPESVRLRAWEILGDIGTQGAVLLLANRLPTMWGLQRRTILRTLIRIPNEAGIEAAIERIGRSGVEMMVTQELRIVGEAVAAMLDLPQDQLPTVEGDLLRHAMQYETEDALERLFLLMKLLYSPSAMQAAAFNILSDSHGSRARGIEILDNTIDLPTKHIVLGIVDKRAPEEKLRILSEVYNYQPMTGTKRLRHLLEIRHCFSAWTIACCFHVARTQWWSLPASDVLDCLEHPTGYVREATLAYLQIASPRVLQRVLLLLQRDRDPLVRAQATAIAAYLKARHEPHREFNRGGGTGTIKTTLSQGNTV